MPVPTRRPLLLIVRDGWGHNPYPEWNHANAVYLARTSVDDRLRASYPWTQIHTSGEDVGLPAGIMGNSEVGHQNIGAGRIVDQEQMRITRTVRDGSFFENKTLRAAVEHAKQNGGSLHVMGLCSDAGVHSALEHAYALFELARRGGLGRDQVLFHAFGDGRDSPPNKGVEYIRQVEARMEQIGVGRVATVVGRFYAMDRDNRWDRVEKTYRLLTETKGAHVPTAAEAFTRYYANPTDASRHGDEFIEPTVVGEPRPIRPGDAVIFFNFRGDRPRELTKAFVYDTFPFAAPDRSGVTETRAEQSGDQQSRARKEAGSASFTGMPESAIGPSPLPDGRGSVYGFARGPRIPNLYYCTMCDYEKDLPVQVAFLRPPKMSNILGAYWSSLGLTQFRCAETEKYPHVTFFFNDYRDDPFPGEEREIIPSPRDVTTYDQKPEMSAHGVTEEMLRRIASDKYDLFVLNFANGDMVGHTGKLDAAIRAVETVDACVGRVLGAVLAKGGAAIVTADHGNCEQMIDPATGGPHTAHTTYDVDLIVVDDRFRSAYDATTGEPVGHYARNAAAADRATSDSMLPPGIKLRENGRLADIAPTLLKLAGIPRPLEMTGQSLV
ncbi:MAG TPA: 2,3-bisphosphoglycerate-independent phosphoglycerate mutase [Phycisphaerae bacterium]|nr:2,3-bisphosphoglycerate-independent phosphoglycerate mutase [Phycisphaerae bacterium]